MKNTVTPAYQIISILCVMVIGQMKLTAQTYPTPGFTLPNGKTIVITYDVDVNANACPDGTLPAANISNQSNVSGSNFTTVQTDDPAFGGASDPTLTPFGALTIGNLVYKDVNKNGIFDGGDAGINGVLLRLYLDNGDGVLTVADGAALATTTTAGGGLYTFNPVCPGNYIVEVATSNFNVGGPLYDGVLMAALVSSPIGGAPDPDNDVNNDDNGDPVSGFGVASQAITLGYNTEPINDGDALANTNLSLDFGFKVPTTITISDVTTNEGSGGGTTAFNFTVTRSDNTDAFSLTVNTMDGTAVSPAEYAAIVAGTVSFTAGGSLTATVTVNVVADNIVEPAESFSVILSGAPASVILSDATGVGNIINDDSAIVTLTGTASQNEGTSFVFTGTLNNPVQGGFSVAYTTNNGTATTADNDYTDNDGTLVFVGNAGETQTFTVISTNDSKVELNETFTVGLGAVTGPSGITTTGTPQTGTILNDDQSIISITPVSMNEGNAGPTIFNFTVTLSNAVDVGIGVPFGTMDGTAVDVFSGTGTDDYNANSGILNFVGTANETQTLSVQVNGDLVVETNETFTAILNSIITSGRNVIFMGGGPTLSTIGTIINDDAATVTLTPAGGISHPEGDVGTTPFVFTVTANNPVQGGFTVNYTTNDGTATIADNDYVDNDGTSVFAGTAGESHTITVLGNGDLNIELNENFTVNLNSISGGPSGATISIAGSPQSGTLLFDELDWGDAPTAAQSGFAASYPTTLAQNGARHTEATGSLHLGPTVDADLDGQPNATATGDGADEDGVTLPTFLITGTTANITVVSSGPGVIDAWIDWNRDGDWSDAGEYILAGAAVLAGSNSLSFAVPAGASVGTSYSRFRLSSAGIALPTGSILNGEVEDYQVSIISNQFSINSPSVAEGNVGTTNLTFTVTRTTNSTSDAVDYAITGGTATSGSDYAPLAAGTLMFPSGGALSQTITVTVNGDLVVEDNETVIITLSNPVNGGLGTNPGTGTITNDDAATLTLTGGISQNETNAGTVPYVFTATLSNNVQGGFQIAYTSDDGTATTADNDYVNNDGTLTFAGTIGETKTFTVLVNGDTKIELDEAFTAALGAFSATSAIQAAAITKVGSPQTGTIINDDAATVSIAANVSQNEANSPQVFSITLSSPVDVPVTVLFNTSNGTAMTTDGDYFGIVNQTVTFPAGTTTTQLVNVIIINDTKVEDNEIYNVAISSLNASGRNVTLGTPSRTGTILNDDTVTLTLSGGSSANEGNSGTNPRVFNVTLGAGVQGGLVDPNGHPRGNSSVVQGGFTVAYFTNDGTATTANSDYVDNDGTLTFAGNVGEVQQITVLVNGDLNIENNETFTVTLGAITNSTPVQIAAITEAGSPQTGTIVNDEVDFGDAPTAAQSGFISTYPTLAINTGARHGEAPGGLHLGATVDADLDGQPNATATGDGADEDGVTLPGALVINTTANITVNSSGTGLLDAWIDFNRDGDWADAGENIFTTQAVVAGNNNLSFAVPAGASLGNSFARFRLSTAGALIPLGFVADGEVEDYAVNIVNTQFSIDNPTVVEGNAGTTNLVFTITRSNNANNCSVDYAITGGTATTADLDYQPFVGGTASFTTGGALTQTVTVVVNGDLKVELNETVIMTLSNPVNSSILSGTGTGTITNDDSGVITITSPSISEGDAGTQNLVFNITMSAISDANVSYNFATADGTATIVNNDYVATSGSQTLTPGQTTKTITVVINGDCAIEPNEIFSVILSSLNALGRNITFSPAGATLTGTGTILNEDFVPVITFCPANVTINCQDSSNPTNTGQATASDDCPGVVVTSTDAIVQGNCVNNYTINRTWKATDNTNDMATCLQVITVHDITPPTISCPGDVTVTCASNVPFPNVEGAFMTSDNCGGVFISFVSDVTINQVCANRFQVARTYRATDFCGNSATCQQTITVFDNLAPTLTCPAPLTFQCASDVPVPNVALITSTDNCSGSSSITFVSDVISNQLCANKYTLTRTYRATDVCGNSATCSQIITVNDNTVPQLTCPQAITVQCATLVPAANVALVTATDNCSGTPTITFVNDVISNQTCINKFIVTRTYRATDLCGNSATCSQTITVNDNTVPTITCPINVTVQCASLVPAVNTASVITADNCGPTPTVTFVSDVISNQTCINRFIVTRTYRSTDACGNSATCSQVITVFDNTAPTITCPANITVQCATDVPAVNTASVVTADNCGGAPTVTFVNDVISNQVCLNRFIVTRTYRSTDACGNSATCAQVITVFDNTAPVITFTDPLIANIPNGGRLDVQCYGQDPNWDIPSFDESSVSVADNCAGTVTVGFTEILQDEGNCPVDGYINLYRLTWTATDVCGNTSSKFILLALVDKIPPVLLNVPADITVNCDAIPAPATNVSAADECISAAIVLFAETPVGPGCQNGKIITRSWTAKDDCGNKSTGVQHITLIDKTGPVIEIQQPELIGVANGTILKYTCNEGGIPEFFDDLNAESIYSPPSCGSPAVITFDRDVIHSVNCKRAGYLEQQTVHWSAVDNCGNKTDLTIIAQLIDKEAPVITDVPDTACIDDPALKFVGATDNCGEAFLRYWDVKIPNSCGSGFAIRRTYEAYDNCGNMSRDTAILIPNDHAAPVMKFVNPKLADLKPGEVLMVDCAGHAGDYTPFGVNDVSVQDGCTAGITVTFKERVLEANGCHDGIVATLSLDWTATDICGNVSTLSVKAFVIDHTPPVLLNFKPEMTIGCKDSLPEITATDNCGQVTINIAQSIIKSTCAYEYDVARVITATDPCGNTTTLNQLIHVGDGSGPVIEGVVPEICDDLSAGKVTAFDPCSGKFVAVTYSDKQLDSPCRDGKVIERIWTATDFCGNVSQVKQLIIIGDKTPPEIQIPTYSIILKYLDAPGMSFVNLSETNIIDQLNALDDGSVYVTDECDVQVIPEFNLQVSYSDNCAADGYFEHRIYTWSATDICGNSSSISFDVYIMDDIPPVLTGVPDDATIICAQLPAVPSVQSDDPAQPVSIVYAQSILPGNGAGVFDVIRTWTATDACGNTTVASQHIIWIPDTFPECEILVPQSVQCNSHGVVISSVVTGGIGGVTYEWHVTGPAIIESGQGTDQILIYVGWSEVTVNLTVKDAHGCTTSCSAIIDCIDSALNPFSIESQTISPQTVPEPGIDHIADYASGSYLTQVNLWPNPANGSVNLSFDSYANQVIHYRLTNFLGQSIVGDKIDAHRGFNTQKIDIIDLPEGSYLMEVKTEKEMYSKIVVIMRNN